MNKKRAELPGADVLFNKDDKHQDVKALKRNNSLSSKGVERLTIYLSNKTLKDIEKAKLTLLTEHNIKVPRSQFVEVLIKKALEKPDALKDFLE